MPVSVDHADVIANLCRRIARDAGTIALLEEALAQTEAALAEATNPPAPGSEQSEV